MFARQGSRGPPLGENQPPEHPNLHSASTSSTARQEPSEVTPSQNLVPILLPALRRLPTH